MGEAVEMSRRRLCLARGARRAPAPGKPNYGLEPLPDLDGNIRTGNALVGFATADEIARAEEHIEEITAAHDEFRRAQFEAARDAALLAEKKLLLSAKQRALGEWLDQRLALAYGADTGDMGAFASWRAGHRPFHWPVEFPAVMRRGGFDAIIGN